MNADPEVSVVVPVFDEAGAAPALAREIAAAFADRDVEIIFVDDASRDGDGSGAKGSDGRFTDPAKGPGLTPKTPARVEPFVLASWPRARA